MNNKCSKTVRLICVASKEIARDRKIELVSLIDIDLEEVNAYQTIAQVSENELRWNRLKQPRPFDQNLYRKVLHSSLKSLTTVPV